MHCSIFAVSFDEKIIVLFRYIAVHADGTPLQVNLALSEEKLANGDLAFIGLLTPAGVSLEIDDICLFVFTVNFVFRNVVKHGVAKTNETVLQSMRKMINSMTVPGMIINEKGSIQAFNKGAEEVFLIIIIMFIIWIDIFVCDRSQLLGYALIEVVGRNVNMLMNDQDAAKHDEYLANYLTTGQAKVIGKERVLMAKHKSGQALEIQLSVTEQTDTNGKKVLFCLSTRSEKHNEVLLITIKLYNETRQIFIGMMHQSKAALEKARKTRKQKKESSSGKEGSKSNKSDSSSGAGDAAPAPEKK
jgi:uncharacterized membrane protein YgcG